MDVLSQQKPQASVVVTTPTTSAEGDAAAIGTATDYARGDHVHAREAFGSPAQSVVGDLGLDGVSASPARADHKHAREGFAAPAASAVADAGTTGTATSLVHSDHKHAREGFGAPAASAVGDAQATGTATTVPHSDHVHQREGFGSPSTQAFGDSAADGTATTVPHSDHKHGWPAPTFATSAPSAVAQSSGLTFTTTRARLFTIGKFVTYVCQVTITQAGTSGQPIAVTLPFTWAANAGQAYGAFRYDRASGASHFGNASQAASTNQIAFAVPTLGFLGISPAFATANGDVLWFTVSGETT